MIRRIAIAALLFGACGSGDDGENLLPESDAGVPADAEPQPDAEPERPAVEAFCEAGGPFYEVLATFGECGGFLCSLEVTGADLLLGEGVSECAPCEDILVGLVATDAECELSEPCSPFFPCDEGVCSGSSGYTASCPAP